jgi:putative glycosyltransferase (TIGR04372 family)
MRTLLDKIIHFIAKAILPLLNLICFPFLILLSITQYRICLVDTSRIGHFFCDLLRFYSNNQEKNLIVIFPKNICNSELLKIYKSYGIKFYKNKTLYRIINLFRLSNTFIKNLHNESAPVSLFNLVNFPTKLHTNDNELVLINQLRERYRPDYSELSKKIGIDEKTIQIHFRSPSFNPDTENIHYARSSPEDLFYEICQIALNQKNKIMRVGGKHYSLRKINNPLYIDYPNSTFKNDKNDILLILFCNKFIGDSTGLSSSINLCRVKCFFFNYLPLSYLPKYETSTVIYKKTDQIFAEPRFYEDNNKCYDNFKNLSIEDIKIPLITFLQNKSMNKYIDSKKTNFYKKRKNGFGFLAKGAIING